MTMISTIRRAGKRWCMCVESGGNVGLRVTTPPQSATFLHRQEACEGDSGFWPPFPIVISATTAKYLAKITSSQHSSATIAYVESIFKRFRVPFWKRSWQQRRNHPGVDRLSSFTQTQRCADGFRFLLGWISPKSAISWVPYPGLPKLLSSATHLVTLHLLNIPHSGYISPEAMVTALSTLTRLEKCCLLDLVPT